MPETLFDIRDIQAAERGEESPVSIQTFGGQPEQPPQDRVDAFFQTQPGATLDAPEWKGARNNWWENFVQQYHSQRYDTLEDYVSFVEGLSDQWGPVGIEEIRPFIQKQALQYMPPKLKAQFQMMLDEKKDDRSYERERARIDRFNNDPKNKTLYMGFDRKVKSRKDHRLEEIANQRKDVRDTIKDLLNIRDSEGLTREDKQAIGTQLSGLYGKLNELLRDPDMMSQKEFETDFQKEAGRPPSPTEMQRARGRHWL